MGFFNKIVTWELLIVLIVLILSLYLYFAFEGFAVTNTTDPMSTTTNITSTVVTPCPPGYWCPISSGASPGFKCPGGRYGSSSGLTLPSCDGPCDKGCLCPEGSTTSCPLPCPEGFFCPEGTGGATVQPIPCPQGYFCPISSSEPTICPTGSFCPTGSTNSSSVSSSPVSASAV